MQGLSREILVPFQMGPEGGIAWTDDRVVQATQQIISIVATQVGERVMRPDYGARMMSALFQPDDPLQQADLQSELQAALSKWASGIQIIAISPEGTSTTDDATIQFKISFQLPGDVNVHTAFINVGGTVHETTFTV